MAKNLEITAKMLLDAGACSDGVELFKKTFGEKVILNAPNIRKAAELDTDGAYTLEKLLKNDSNKLVYMNYNSEHYNKWDDLCSADDHDAANGNALCKLRGVEYRIKVYTKFVELYRKENKAPRKARGKR